MEERLHMILTEEEIGRLCIEEAFLTLDVHWLTVVKMSLLVKNVSLIPRQPFSLKIIHGYNHGTVLKEAIRKDKIVARPHTIVTDEKLIL